MEERLPTSKLINDAEAELFAISYSIRIGGNITCQPADINK